MSGALKGEAAHVLITLHGDNVEEGQNGDVLPVPQPHSSTVLQSPFMQLPSIRIEHELSR